MDISTFLEMKPEWAYEPCLYIVKQMFPGNNAHRCGASGTQQFHQSDRAYGSGQGLTGLLSRISMYKGFWEPLHGTIYAALRIRKQLVAKPTQRVGTDFVGNMFNIDRGNQTLVLAREADFHAELDRRGLRWNSERRNELFVPKKNVEELIAALRTIPGEDMFLFDTDTIIDDTAYRSGSRPRTTTVIDTTSRGQPPRAVKDTVPTVTLKLSKVAIEQLRSNNPNKYQILSDLVRDIMFPLRDKTAPPATHAVSMTARALSALRDAKTNAARAKATKMVTDSLGDDDDEPLDARAGRLFAANVATGLYL